MLHLVAVQQHLGTWGVGVQCQGAVALEVGCAAGGGRMVRGQGGGVGGQVQFGAGGVLSVAGLLGGGVGGEVSGGERGVGLGQFRIDSEAGVEGLFGL